MYAYNHLTNPANTESGIAPMAWLAPLNWFATNGLKKPTPDEEVGSEVTITENHTFPAGFGFLRFLLSPEKNSYNAEIIGDKGHTKFNHSIKIFVPGSYDEVHEQMKLLKNIPLIALVKDSTCESGIVYQVGNACNAAYIKPGFSTGTTVEGVKGYEVEITAQSANVTLYAGTITLAAEMLATPVISSLANSSNNFVIDWDAVPNADRYIVLISTNPDLSNPTQVLVSSPTTTYTADWDTLTGPSRYYFGVRAEHSAGTYRPSRPNFGSLTRPVLTPVALLNLGTPVNTGPGEWRLGVVHDANTTHVRFQISETEGDFSTLIFNELVAKDIFTAPALYCLIVGLLDEDTTYYWRAKASAAGFADSPWYVAEENILT